jgi:hypothetical protein
MKRLIYLSLFISLILYSCESIPEAHFYTDTVEPAVGQEVFFTNDSQNATSFEWDFGDGFISNAENPSHIFTGSGAFVVSLTAISKKGIEDIATITIDVVIPTLLEIEVLEWETYIKVPGASVFLYPTKETWESQTNKFSEGFTDDNSLVVFSGLDPKIYYVDVWEEYHDNYTLAADDIGFIQTPQILPNRINRFVALVDYVQHKKGTARGERSMVIRKLERKADSSLQPAASSDTEGWEEMYARRVNK